MFTFLLRIVIIVVMTSISLMEHTDGLAIAPSNSAQVTQRIAAAGEVRQCLDDTDGACSNTLGHFRSGPECSLASCAASLARPDFAWMDRPPSKSLTYHVVVESGDGRGSSRLERPPSHRA